MSNYVFEGWTANPDDLEQWANSLMLEVDEGDTGGDDGIVVPLVKVETNYKPGGRVVNYPVHLTAEQAIKAATALVSLTQGAIEGQQVDGQELSKTHDDGAVIAVLEHLAECDSAIWELRTCLHNELRHRRQQAADKRGGDTEKGEN